MWLGTLEIAGIITRPGIILPEPVRRTIITIGQPLKLNAEGELPFPAPCSDK